MKSLAFATAAGIFLAGTAMAQTTTGTRPPTGTEPATAVPMTPADTSNSNTAAASGNDNQAVATTSANSPAPAKGANSFTRGEARRRIEKHGFTNVSGLAKDRNGVWRGQADKGGNSTSVWLDYKGNIGATN